LIDEIEDGFPRTEIIRNGEDVLWALSLDREFRLLVAPDVRAPEPVYRLFRISHQEKLTRPNALFLPRLIGAVFAAQQEQDLALQGIRILEFVDQYMSVAICERGTNGRMRSQEIAGKVKDIVEIEQCRFPFEHSERSLKIVEG
jgi:hypothetical protein